MNQWNRFTGWLAIALLRLLGHDVRAGRYCRIRRGAEIEARRGTVRIGEKVKLERGAILSASGGSIVLGDRVSLNPYAIVYGHGGVEIGSHTRIAAHVVIISANHRFDDPGRTITSQGLDRKGIRIGRDVWIGTGARILDGSDIGDGCVIGANAVVRGRTEPNGVYVGVPARRIRTRGEPPAGR